MGKNDVLKEGWASRALRISCRRNRSSDGDVDRAVAYIVGDGHLLVGKSIRNLACPLVIIHSHVSAKRLESDARTVGTRRRCRLVNGLSLLRLLGSLNKVRSRRRRC